MSTNCSRIWLKDFSMTHTVLVDGTRGTHFCSIDGDWMQPAMPFYTGNLIAF